MALILLKILDRNPILVLNWSSLAILTKIMKKTLRIEEDQMDAQEIPHLKWLLSALTLTTVIWLSGCNSTAMNNSSFDPQALLSVSPISVTVLTSGTQQFTASGPGSGAVTWLVNGVAGGSAASGTISTGGLYTAPAVPPSPNTVTVSATRGSQSFAASVQVISPQPQANSLAPAATTTGSGNTTVSVTGAGFNPTTMVTVNGVAIATNFVSSSQITAVISAAQNSLPGWLDIGVITPAPGGGMSGPLVFTVVNEGAVSATAHPLVASYSLVLPRDGNARVDFGLDTTYAQRTWFQPAPAGGGRVDILVAGMKASTTYHIRAVADFLDGSEYVGPDQTFTTGSTSSFVFPMLTVTPGVGTPNSGVEHLEVIPNLQGLGANTSDATQAVLVTDLQGNPIWFYNNGVPNSGDPWKLLPNSHVLVSLGSILNGGILREIDLAGNTIRQTDVPTLNQALATSGFNLSILGLHHDLAPLPNGHTILLTDYVATVTRTTGTVNIQADALIDIDENWNPVWVWKTTDHLDVNRIVLDPIDWTHANAVVYSPDDGNLILSMRNQSWVVKIDYANGNGTGNLLWTSGYQGNLALTGNNPAQWHYGQHFPFVIGEPSAGTFQMAVYDDGNKRVVDSSGTTCGPLPNPCYTRAVIYSIDETSLTSTELWEDNVAPIFTPFIGSIEQLENGNVEFDLGVVSLSPPGARVLEVTRTTPPQTVWQMDSDHLLYRAYRIPSLYPGVQW